MAWEILVSVIIPWIRTIVSLPLGLVAIQLFHLAAGRLMVNSTTKCNTQLMS